MSEDFKEVQDMLEQAKELVKTLENKYNELNKPKNVRWRAEKGERYYLLSNEGSVGHTIIFSTMLGIISKQKKRQKNIKIT